MGQDAPGEESLPSKNEWFYYYDALGRLTEIRYTPDISASTTYSLYQIAWLGTRPIVYNELDYPGPTVSKRYTVTDEANRITQMWSWPSSGDSTRVWAINPSAWAADGWSAIVVGGSTMLQPLVFPGQYQDWETYTYLDTTAAAKEPAVVLNGARTYDPFTGGYLQDDPLVDQTRSSYVYSDSDPVGAADSSGLEVIVIDDPGDCSKGWYSEAHPDECLISAGCEGGDCFADAPPIGPVGSGPPPPPGGGGAPPGGELFPPFGARPITEFEPPDKGNPAPTPPVVSTVQNIAGGCNLFSCLKNCVATSNTGYETCEEFASTPDDFTQCLIDNANDEQSCDVNCNAVCTANWGTIFAGF